MSLPYYNMDCPSPYISDPYSLSPQLRDDQTFHMTDPSSKKRRAGPNDWPLDGSSPGSVSRKIPKLDEEPQQDPLLGLDVFAHGYSFSPQPLAEEDSLLDPFIGLGRHLSDPESDMSFPPFGSMDGHLGQPVMPGYSVCSSETAGTPQPTFALPGPPMSDMSDPMAFSAMSDYFQYPPTSFNPASGNFGSMPHPSSMPIDIPTSSPMTFSSSAPTNGLNYMLERHQPPRPFIRSVSPQQMASRPSMPRAARSGSSARIAPQASPVPSSHPSPGMGTPGHYMCNRCNTSCRGEKALHRHVVEQHDMTTCHLCPLCSNLVEFDPTHDHHSTLANPQAPLKCSHCDDEDVYLHPSEIRQHFQQHHYHCLSSSRMYFIKRPLDLTRHFKSKMEKDEGHRWLHDMPASDVKEHFKIEDGHANVVRGCDHCEHCMGSLAEFVNHVSQAWKDGHRHSDKCDRAFSMQVRNLLESPRLQATWAVLVQQNGEPERYRWKYSGEQASTLLKDLENAASRDGDEHGEVCARAHRMMED